MNEKDRLEERLDDAISRGEITDSEAAEIMAAEEQEERDREEWENYN